MGYNIASKKTECLGPYLYPYTNGEGNVLPYGKIKLVSKRNEWKWKVAICQPSKRSLGRVDLWPLIQACEVGGWQFEDVRDIGAITEYAPPWMIISYKEENGVLMVEKPGTHQHEQVVKVNISSDG